MNSKFIGYVAGLVIENEKCLVRTAGHQKRTSSKSKLKQSKATNANYKSTKPMKSKSTSQFRNKSNI
jgi:hypothetical protein